MKIFGIVLAAIGGAILGYFSLVGIDAGVEGLRVTNIAGLFLGSALFVGGSVFAAAGEAIERLVLMSESPRTVVVKETIGATPTAPRNIAPIAKPSAQRRPQKEGEQVLTETYNGVQIFQRFNGHYVEEKWFAGIKQARAYIDNLALDQLP